MDCDYGAREATAGMLRFLGFGLLVSTADVSQITVIAFHFKLTLFSQFLHIYTFLPLNYVPCQHLEPSQPSVGQGETAQMAQPQRAFQHLPPGFQDGLQSRTAVGLAPGTRASSPACR